MRLRLIVMTLTALALLSPYGAAQRLEEVPQAKPTPPPAPAAGLKVGLLDVQEAIGRTQEGQKASEELQAEFGPRQTQLQKLNQEITNLENQLRTQERTLSEAARLQLMRDLDRKRRAAQRDQEDLQADVQEAQSDRINNIWQKMQRVLDQYAREKGYAIIINSSPANSPVIYAAPAVDVTEDIVRLFDQAYPVATPKQPAPPAPAGQPQEKRPPQPPPPR